MDEQAPGIEAVAAALRSDGQDLALYAGFLLSTLCDALPEDMVDIARKRSTSDRLKGRPGEVVGVSVTAGDRRFLLERNGVGARPEASVAHLGAGIVLNTKTVPLDDWSEQLAGALVSLGGRDARAAAALQKLTITRGADL